ncbi:MAG: ABC transporter ATP-binding protein [Clostridia bacterium]|nr:ABC transporter ATP-binding protein [Clostridia bacterium]
MKYKVDSLSFSYKDLNILNNISFEINSGEAVCLIGPNGSGKTTLLDCVMGLHIPQQGAVTVEGRNVLDFSRKDLARFVSYLPQTHMPMFPYTVREMVLMGRSAYSGVFGQPGADDEKFADEAISSVGIESLALRQYTSLSGGEIKLVLLARALAQNAGLIVLDEPTASLDLKNEYEFLETLFSLIRERDISVLMATHSIEQAFRFEEAGISAETLMMRKGREPLKGAPSDVITSGSIGEVFGVSALISTATGESGRQFRSVSVTGKAD